jgi:SAM-dependent methyltransferase
MNNEQLLPGVIQRETLHSSLSTSDVAEYSPTIAHSPLSSDNLDRHLARVSAAFSRKATVYDAFGEDHENLARMRQKVYDHISALVAPGSYLLELNAGTGLDAAAMVQRGYHVHATDISPGMVAEIEAKIERDGLAGRLTTQQCSFTDLGQLSKPTRSSIGRFDAIYSNFGGLNCIADLTAVTRHFPSLLRPGGHITCVIMPPICPWELAITLKDFRVGTRRLHRRGVVANVEGVTFRTCYFTPHQMRQSLGPRFRQVRLEGLSVLTPTADNKTFARRHPRLFHALVAFDDRLSQRPPFNGWGDFFILSAELEG